MNIDPKSETPKWTVKKIFGEPTLMYDGVAKLSLTWEDIAENLNKAESEVERLTKINEELVKALTGCIEYCHDETAAVKFKHVIEALKPLNHEQS